MDNVESGHTICARVDPSRAALPQAPPHYAASGGSVIWSWKVGRLFGIPVYLDTTFLLLMGFILLAQWREGGNLVLHGQVPSAER